MNRQDLMTQLGLQERAFRKWVFLLDIAPGLKEYSEIDVEKLLLDLKSYKQSVNITELC